MGVYSVNRILITCGFLSTILLSACVKESPTTSLRDYIVGTGVDNHKWVVLRNPSTAWDVGTIIEVDGNEVEDIGNIANLDCFPESKWIVTEADTASTSIDRDLAYGLSLSATFGVPQQDIASAGIQIGGDPSGEGEPNHQVRVRISEATEKAVDFTVLEDFLGTRGQNGKYEYENLSFGCKNVVNKPNRYIVTKSYSIVSGSLRLVDGSSATLNLNLPQYSTIKSALLSAGYAVSSNGEITFDKNKPITVAVRGGRFDDILSELQGLGIPLGGGTGETLEQALTRTGAAVPEN